MRLIILTIVFSFAHLIKFNIICTRGASVNAANTAGDTPLILSAANGLGAMITLLLDNGANIAAKNALGETAFLKACSKGKNTVATLLLLRGRDVPGGGESQLHARNNAGYTALLLASYANHIHTVALLADKGADLNAVSISGMSAMMLACANNNVEVALLLARRGALIRLPSGKSALTFLTNEVDKRRLRVAAKEIPPDTQSSVWKTLSCGLFTPIHERL